MPEAIDTPASVSIPWVSQACPASTPLADGEGPQVVAGDNLGAATRKLSHPAARSLISWEKRTPRRIRPSGIARRKLIRTAEALAGEGSGKEKIHSRRRNPIVAALSSALVTDFQFPLPSSSFGASWSRCTG